jgi:pimeloyl-ACP methyl ester carboxylesterase
MFEQLLKNPDGIREEKLITTRTIIGAIVSEPESVHAGTIVMVPGFSGSKEDFVAVMPILTSLGWHCFAIDQYGQPASFGSNDENDFTMNLLAQDLIDIANSFPEPIHVIGHSFGGLVSQIAVTKSPKSFASLTLMCSGPGALPRNRWGGLPRLVKATEKYNMSLIWTLKTIAEKLVGYRKFSRKVRKWRRQRWIKTNPLSIKTMGQLLMTIDPIDEKLKQSLSKYPVPIFVIAGHKDDIWPLSQQKEMATFLHGRYVEVLDSGHSPARENPQATAIEIDTFLKTI